MGDRLGCELRIWGKLLTCGMCRIQADVYIFGVSSPLSPELLSTHRTASTFLELRHQSTLGPGFIMTSIYALTVLICICLYAQTPAQGALTKIIDCSRIDLGDRFRFIVNFEADSDVKAEWSQAGGVPMADTKLEPGLAVGEVTLTGRSYQPWVSLSLGVMSEHYVKLEWNVFDRGNREFRGSELQYDMSTVTPGTDIAYIPGSTKEIHVAVNETRGSGHLSFSHFQAYVTGVFVDPSTNKVVGTEGPPFVTYNVNSVNHVSTTTLTFQSDDVIDGYFRSFLGGNPTNRDASPLHHVDEVIVLSVHEENKPVSF